ncbi:MAG: L,D-transpeptidase family protein [Roseburia sp.]
MKDTAKRKKWGLLAIGVLVVLLVAVYIGIGYYFRSHFAFHTSIDGIDVSGKTVEEVKDRITEEISSYTLEITGREGMSETVAGTSLGIYPVFSGEIELLMEEQGWFIWIKTLFEETNLQLGRTVNYDADALEEVIDELSCMKNQRMPVNAECSEYKTASGYTLIPADYGTALDRDGVILAVEKAVLSLHSSVDLEEADCYLEPEVGDDDAQLLTKIANLNHYAGVTITYDFDEKREVLDGSRISTWLSLDDNGTVQVDEEGVLEFVKELAAAYNTAYQAKTLKTSYGSTVTITGGAYGWKIDTAAETEQILSDLAAGVDVEREPVYSLRANSHGENDYGNSYVEINLTLQHLFVYKDGVLVVESDFVSGNVADGHATPTGAFPVTYTTTNAILRGADYETPVSFWMPYNGNIGMHDATWRTTFGGNIYKTNGSHGCINLPYSVAQTIYNTIDQGYAILVYTTPGAESQEIQQQDAATVTGIINSIGEVTLASGTAIMSARNLYDVLPDSAKAYVTNYDVLVNAEAVYAGLLAAPAQPADPAAAQTADSAAAQPADETAPAQ